MTEAAVEADHSRSQLPTLTAFRWWAALVVFAFHLDAATGWLPVRPFGFGQAGVSFFFVLSGFVLTWSSHGRPVAAWTFYRRRFARVYPAHAAMFLVVALLVAVVPGAPFDHSVLGAVGNLTLTQAWAARDDLVFSFNGPAWSLSAEAFFYLVFPALLPRMRTMTERTRTPVVVAVVLLGLLVTVALAAAGLGRVVAFPNPLVRLPEFVLGIALALRFQRRPPRRISMPLALVVLALSAPLALVAPLFPLRDYVLLPATVLLISAAVSSDLRRPDRNRRRVGVYFGELSFAFYLVHLVVLQLLLAGPFQQVEWSVFGGAGPAAAAFVLALGCAVLLHHGVERPCQAALSGRRTSARDRTPA